MTVGVCLDSRKVLVTNPPSDLLLRTGPANITNDMTESQNVRISDTLHAHVVSLHPPCSSMLLPGSQPSPSGDGRALGPSGHLGIWATGWSRIVSKQVGRVQIGLSATLAASATNNSHGSRCDLIISSLFLV